MRILFLTPTLGIGGSEKLTVSYALGMQSRGHEVGIAFGFNASLADRPRAAGIELFDLSPRHLKPATLPEWTWQLRKAIRAFRPDVVHAQSVRSGLCARLAAPRVPLLVTVHGIRQSDEALASLVFRAANVKLTAVSEASADGLRRRSWVPDVEVFSPGVDVEQIRIDARPDEPVALVGEPSLCCVARQEQANGVDVLLRAFVVVLRDLPRAGLTLVGPGLEYEANRKLATRLGIADHVQFIELTDNAAPYLAAADTVVLPSRRAGLPVVALEALALERPIVATRVGGTSTVVVDGETGWLVPPEDEHALAAAILASLRDPEEAARRGRAGRALVEERFSAGPMLDRIETRLAELVPQTPGTLQSSSSSPATATGFRARVLTTELQLDEVAPAWDALRLEAEASPFLGPVLYRAWLDEFGGVKPLVVAVEDPAGRLVGVAPLVRRGPLVFSLPGRVKVTGELLVRRSEEATDVWRAVLGAVFERRRVRAFLVPHATDDLAGVEGAKEVLGELSLGSRAYPRFRRFFLGLEGTTWDAHHAGWSKNRRAHLRKARNKLDRLGTVEFREATALEAYDVLREIHRRQWEPRRSVSWVHLDAGARVDRRLLAEVPSRVLLLELDGKAIAATLWLDSGRRRIVLYLTRDPSITESSPGELLHAETVRRAFRDNVRELDFMGEGGKKHRYELEGHIGYELVVARSGLVGSALLLLHSLLLRLRGRGASLRLDQNEDQGADRSLLPGPSDAPAPQVVATIDSKSRGETALARKQDAA